MRISKSLEKLFIVAVMFVLLFIAHTVVDSPAHATIPPCCAPNIAVSEASGSVFLNALDMTVAVGGFTCCCHNVNAPGEVVMSCCTSVRSCCTTLYISQAQDSLVIHSLSNRFYDEPYAIQDILYSIFKPPKA